MVDKKDFWTSCQRRTSLGSWRCSASRPASIEFLNAKIGRWFNPRTPNSSIDNYTKVTSILKGIEEIQRALYELLLQRKPQAKENDRLRAMYLSPA